MGFVDRSKVTRNRTLRLDSAFLTELEAEAEKQGISVNNLMERIVERYINHTRWIDEIGSLTIHQLTLQNIFDTLSEEQILELGSTLGSRFSRESFMVRGLSLDDDMARYLVEKVLGGYDHWFSASYHHHSRPYFLLRTTLGDKWLMFVEAYLKAFYRENLGIELECNRFGSSLQILL